MTNGVPGTAPSEAYPRAGRKGGGGGETTRPTGEGYANMQSGGRIDSHGALREPPRINGYREETCIAERQL